MLIRAQKEYFKFPRHVQEKFSDLFKGLIDGKKLHPTKFKKLENSYLYEFRVKYDTNIYRALGAFILPNILIVSYFQKKTQKTPENEIKTAISRYKNYLLNLNDENDTKL